MSAGDVSRLPKWAQERLGRLERDIRALEDRLAEAHQAAGFHAGEETYGRLSLLDPTATVRFQVPDPHPVRLERGVMAELDVAVERGRLRVRATGGGLDIRPEVTNTISVGVIR